MANPPSDTYLTDISPSDRPWDGHRADSELVSAGFAQGGYERFSERINQCSNRLAFAQEALETGDTNWKLYAAQFCRVRLCPVCQWRKQLMWRARFFKALPKYLDDHQSYVPVLLTLTLRNCELTDLRETINHVHQSFQRLSQRKCWPARGWVRSLEVTRNIDTKQAHPHLHVLMFVRKAYFRGKGYIKIAEWVQLWRECLRVNYDPNIDIRRVKGSTENDSVWDKLTDKNDCNSISENLLKGICETLKYSVKPSDLISDPEWLTELARQLHNVRSVAVGGDLRAYLSDEEPDDLIHGDEDELDDDSQYPSVVFDWGSEVKRYKLSSHQ